MKIHLANTSPNGSSTQTVGISGPHPGRDPHASHQSLHPEGTLAVSLPGETNLQFEISGDIETTQLTLNSVCVKANATAKENEEGEGRITVKKNGTPILVIEVAIGGNVTIGLVIDSLD